MTQHCKKLLLIFALTANTILMVAQDFTWMHGSSIGNQFTVYGTLGVPGAINTPGIRHSSATWRDNSGNLWLFGGNGYTASNGGNLNDMWKYNISTNQWTWVGGSNQIDQLGVYGTQGVAHPANMPGARYGAETWVDAAGNFWMFGGNGYGSTNANSWLNDLWKYNVSTNQWTWMKGSTIGMQPAVFGTQGIGAPGNTPGAKWSTVTWADAAGNFWLFGGGGFAAGPSGLMNDLWKYDVTANQWIWMMGSNSIGAAGNYGTQHVAAPTNMPGARHYTKVCKDNSGNIWLFGGEGYGSGAVAGRLSDLWKFNPVTTQWTWVSGNNGLNQNGVYGTLGSPNIGNLPGGRQGFYMWGDAMGNIWVFGGKGFPATGALDDLNDMWKYNIANNQWTWVKGNNTANQNGVYGAVGVSAPTNVPGARSYGSTWTDGGGNLWLFGGQGYINSSYHSALNDLWKFGICNLPSPPLDITPPVKKQICAYGATTLSVSSAGNVNWYANPTSGTSLGAGTVYVTPSLSASTVFYAEAITCGPSASRTAVSIIVNPLPVITASANTNSVCVGSSANLAANGASSYTWQPGNQTGFFITVNPPNSTHYTVSATDSNGCIGDTSISIAVLPLPILTVNSNSPVICLGQSSNIGVNGAQIYNWQPGGLQGFLVTVSPSVSTVYTVTGSDAIGCASSATISLVVENCNSIGEGGFTTESISVYPNPSQGDINVEGQGLEKIEIYDLLGRKVKQLTVEGESHQKIACSGLTPGVYTVKILTLRITKTVRLVVEN